MSETELEARDTFAIAALPAIILGTCAGQHQPKSSPDEKMEDAIAASAYLIADAMIRARKAILSQSQEGSEP